MKLTLKKISHQDQPTKHFENMTAKLAEYEATKANAQPQPQKENTQNDSNM